MATTTTSTTTTLLLDDGLLLHLTMDTAHIYGTRLDDQSGNNNDGEMVPAVPVPGVCGYPVNVIS